MFFISNISLYAQEPIWEITISNIELTSELRTEEIIPLYTGDVQTLIHIDAPINDTSQYLLVNLQVNKLITDESNFNISSTTLYIENIEYLQLDNAFLENHNRKPFTQNDIRFGDREGYIAFEIPLENELLNACLSINGELYPLQTTIVEDGNANLLELESITDKQWEIEHQLLEDYNLSTYTLDNPYVILDPYQWSPLSALVMFETTQPASVFIEVVGKDEYSTITHNFTTLTTSHQIPILGLYADYSNTVNITLTYENGEEEENTLSIITDKLINSTDLLDVQLVTSTPKKMQEGLTFLQPTGTGKNPMAVDANGDIRWILYYDVPQLCKRLENGNTLILLEDLTGFYEIDLLGKVYSQFSDLQKIHHDVIELPNGNFLTTSMDDSGYKEDRILELDRTTGQLVHDIDFKDILDVTRLNRNNDLDWLHMNSLWYDENDNSLIISGRN